MVATAWSGIAERAKQASTDNSRYFYRKWYKSAMTMIPTANVQKRLRVLMATSRVGIKAHINLFCRLISMVPLGARTLMAVKPPNTAGATKDNQRCRSLGNSNRENSATGRIRGNKETADTHKIIIQMLVALTDQHPQTGCDKGCNNDIE